MLLEDDIVSLNEEGCRREKQIVLPKPRGTQINCLFGCFGLLAFPREGAGGGGAQCDRLMSWLLPGISHIPSNT